MSPCESRRSRQSARRPRRRAAFCRSRLTRRPRSSRPAARRLSRIGKSLQACATAARSSPRRWKATDSQNFSHSSASVTYCPIRHWGSGNRMALLTQHSPSTHSYPST
eukprot:6172021-Pleurochrysis_carterae.AAC.1